MSRRPVLEIEKRRDSHGGRRRLYPVGELAEVWAALMKGKRQYDAAHPVTITEAELEALDQLGVQTRITVLED